MWSRKIRELRFLEGLKQDQLAMQLGVSQASVSQWERGVAIPPKRLQDKLRVRFVTSPTDQVIRALRNSVKYSPNLCGLISFRSGDLWLEEQSDAGFEIFPLLERDDIGDRLQGKLGQEVDHVYDAIIREGIFSGDLAGAVSRSIARKDGSEIGGVSTFSPFCVDGTWLIRAEVRLVNAADLETENPSSQPRIDFQNF